jgi:capsule polysaccharide export protein KpsE/RkpR
VFRSTYVEEQPKVVKKDLGDVKSVMQDVEDIKCVKKNIERIREEQQMHHNKVSPNLHMDSLLN